MKHLRTTGVLAFLAILVLNLVLTGCSTEQGVQTDTSTPASTTTSTTTTASFVPPKMINFSTQDVGSQSYTQSAIIADAMLQEYGTKVRVIPMGTDVSKIASLRMKDVDVAIAGAAAASAQNGLAEFSAIDWGPQNLRVVWLSAHPGATVIVKGDSTIKTAPDLKGKKVAYILGGPAVNEIVESHLAFAGLTWADVQKVDFPSWGASVKAVSEGAVDATGMTVAASQAYEMQAAPGGMRFLPLPASDTEGWARVKKVRPDWTPMKAMIGAGLSAEMPLETATYPFPVLTAYDWSDEDKMYFVTKSLWETYDEFAAKDAALKAYWSSETFIDLFDGSVYALHPGAIKYLKEQGLWTAEREQKNNQIIERLEKLREAWDAVVLEATQKQIKSADFPAFWLERRPKI